MLNFAINYRLVLSLTTINILIGGIISIFEGPSLTQTDISTGNGVVHLTDGIVFPSDLLATFKQLESRSFFNRQPVLATAAVNARQATNKPRFGFTRRKYKLLYWFKFN